MLSRIAFLCSCLVTCLVFMGQQPSVEVPRLIRFSGQLHGSSGTVGITFALHKSQEDSATLWSETQNVTLADDGKYSVLLGATTAGGVPTELFTSGEAHWLSIHVEGQAEERVLLVSVPYALKAAEAESLGGHAAGDFVTSQNLGAAVQTQLQQLSASGFNVRNSVGVKGNVVTDMATNFTDNNSSQIVLVTQNGAGNALVANAITGNGLQGSTANAAAYGVVGINTAASGTAVGMRGTTGSAGGIAVYGTSNATSGTGTGVKGISASPNGYGVFGQNSSPTGAAYGFRGSSASTGGVAIYGTATATSGTTKGLVASVASVDGIGAVFQNTNSSGKLLSGQSGSASTEVFSVAGNGDVTTQGGFKAPGNTTNYIGGLLGVQTTTPNAQIDVEGTGNLGILAQKSSCAAIVAALPSTSSVTCSTIFAKNGASGAALYAESTGTGPSIHAENDTTTASGVGIEAVTNSESVLPLRLVNSGGGLLMAGYASNSSAVRTFSIDSQGDADAASIFAESSTSIALEGISEAASFATGVYGEAFGSTSRGVEGYSDTGYAGYFNGNVYVSGSVSKSGGSFKIDHPLDPANKYLSHSFVESPDMMNIYNGIAVLDARGEAVVTMPEWFEALNRDFRYQLTSMGAFMPVYVAEEISGNRFKIAGGKPGKKVSWQVTGIRHDAWANANRIPVEEEKAGEERGTYVHPQLFGQPESAGVDYKRQQARKAEAAKHRALKNVPTEEKKVVMQTSLQTAKPN
ncbi:hypothetical protein Acid345_1334 [Candidatus Koribacter versatilis Ellin345]|uniref:Uncharacterized protein n=1 Tax=Koribacter versatilis (strain Ellin345) TaxID=204669 RepID=Q1IS14_KORVE|nr:hypothetical protein [Candidatus Koribacter versatilis]ABF40336.1 hypothetical protein Acid345_1334 [Candidatus Koribacter versatilis Ellin345]